MVLLLLPMGLLIIAINKINLCGKMINSQGVAVIGRRFAAHPKGTRGGEEVESAHDHLPSDPPARRGQMGSVHMAPRIGTQFHKSHRREAGEPISLADGLLVLN